MELDVNDSSWSRHGWTFQEQILPSRLLIFGEHMLHFWCSEVERSENGYEEPSYYKSFPQILELLRTGQINLVNDRDQYFDLFGGWMGRLVESNLKFNTDRLPAVAGLAQLQFEHLRPNYEGLLSHIDPAGSTVVGRLRSGSLTFITKMRLISSLLDRSSPPRFLGGKLDCLPIGYLRCPYTG